MTSEFDQGHQSANHPTNNPQSADGLVRLTPLGGVGAFGRNCLLVEDLPTQSAIVVDCGVRFLGDDEAPGFDVGLPDLQRLRDLGDKLLGYFITHGHEDHIGALPYAVQQNPAPIWATAFTKRLIERRFHRYDVDIPRIDVVKPSNSVDIGPFRVTWINVSHSIPDATALAIHTRAGVMIHSGDFRIDLDPVVGRPTDMRLLTKFGDDGVRCLLADSTGATTDGFNPGERSVYDTLAHIFEETDGRLVVAIFASHISRLSLVAELCRRFGRKMVLLGRSLEESYEAARDLKILDISDLLVSKDHLSQMRRDAQCIVVTGSQGEPQSALVRMMTNRLFGVTLSEGDSVVLSARAIPGNERRVLLLADQLLEQGVHVYAGSDGAHVSGHGYSGDLEQLILATRPRTFVALHGGAKQLLGHASLAHNSGIDDEDIVPLRDGSPLIFSENDFWYESAPLAFEPLAVDGVVSYHPAPVIAPRRRMQEAGALLVHLRDPIVMDGRVWLDRKVQVACEGRGLSPWADMSRLSALSDELTDAIGHASPEETAQQMVIRIVNRFFRRHQKPAPEIFVVDIRAGSSATSASGSASTR